MEGQDCRGRHDKYGYHLPCDGASRAVHRSAWVTTSSNPSCSEIADDLTIIGLIGVETYLLDVDLHRIRALCLDRQQNLYFSSPGETSRHEEVDLIQSYKVALRPGKRDF